MFTGSYQERYRANNVYTIKCKFVDTPKTFAAIINEFADKNVHVDDIKVVDVCGEFKCRDLRVFCDSTDKINDLVESINKLDGVEVTFVADEVRNSHLKGSIEVKSRKKIDSLTDLRMVYTPGVASACNEIVENPEKAWEITGICDRVAIVSDGTAVLGLGDIGAQASLPVMEGKAAIFAEFVGISGFPIVLNTKEVDKIIETVALMAPTFGAIQLEDIAAPACFEIEEKLREKLDIPVFHDDQHATATVVLAALINSLKKVNKKPQDCKAVVVGAGAAGYAITKILLNFGLDDIVVYDAGGAIYRGRTEMMNPYLEKLAQQTNKQNISGPLDEGFKDRDIFIGVARPNLVNKQMIASMADRAIAFPLSNPVGEISLDDAREAGAEIVADGRTINNALAFPGLFRGALDARAEDITPEMQMAAANKLAELAGDDSFLPDMIDREVHKKVAQAVMQAAK